MLFNSWPFVVLVIVTVGLFYSPGTRRFQNQVLILSSFVFYGYSNPGLLALLFISILLNAVISYLILFTQLSKSLKWAGIGITINLLILLFFKYGPLFAKTFITPFFKNEFSHFLLTIPLPIGISFFTFQGISLIVDFYRTRAQSDTPLRPESFSTYLTRIAVFKAFFPQLIAGPIVKAHEFLPQMGQKLWRNINWEGAIKALVVGYFLKMVIADNLKEHTFYIAFPYFQGFSSFTLATLLFGYSMQIFADFAGYSLIAVGLGLLFGYRLPNNFNFPYIAASFSDFWKRWHISLSTWLRLYLYIPLGGNRTGRLRTYFNLMVVMVLGGLWHGAAWSYAVWGCFHGLLLALERFLADRIDVPQGRAVRIAYGAVVFCCITLAWLLFKLPNFNDAVLYLNSILENKDLPHQREGIFAILLFSIPVTLYHAHSVAKNYSVYCSIFRRIEPLIYGFLLVMIIFNSGSAGDFIYFQF